MMDESGAELFMQLLFLLSLQAVHRFYVLLLCWAKTEPDDSNVDSHQQVDLLIIKAFGR